MTDHAFAGDRYRCDECSQPRVHQNHHPIVTLAANVRVQAVIDMDHLVRGQRVLIDGEPYEVSEVFA